MPTASASAGWMRARWTRSPRISFSELCIQELWERSSRIPIISSGKSGDGGSISASRSISAAISGGAEMHELVRVADLAGERAGLPVVAEHDPVRVLAAASSG